MVHSTINIQICDLGQINHPIIIHLSVTEIESFGLIDSMTTAPPNTTTVQIDDHPTKTIEPVPATTAEGVSSEKSPASSVEKKDGDSGETKLKPKDPVTETADNSNSNNSEDGASVNDTQRKIRRAERFGMPVQLSEEEKRNSRAERFGTAPGSQGSDATKKAEELKRKARAERFGITQSTPIEEDEKKKARLSRKQGHSGFREHRRMAMEKLNRRRPLLARQVERLEACTLSFAVRISNLLIPNNS
ncbi:hypothetical protein L6452_11399 [Arctium lappa]|uniref:Uncharacterized protein n=1 Tax=Arctium lappa TaxID=4217 RepID=A0ACB9DNU6_ARCLA|nr:hypothetical protein L6452_11399 [Arctium lappa]